VGRGQWEYGRGCCGGLAILLLTYDCLFINSLIAQSPKKYIFPVFAIYRSTRVFFTTVVAYQIILGFPRETDLLMNGM